MPLEAYRVIKILDQKNYVGNFFPGATSFWRVEVPSLKINLNISQIFKKLHCKGESYGDSG